MVGILLDSIQNYDYDTKEVEFGIDDTVYRAMGKDELFDLLFNKIMSNFHSVEGYESSNTWGTQDANSNKKFYKCFFRSPEESLNFILVSSEVIVEFYKDSLKQYGKLRPYCDEPAGGGKFEYEERLYSKNKNIKVNNPKNLVKQIWVLTSNGIPYLSDEEIEQVKQNGFKIRLYPNFGYESDEIDSIDPNEDEDAYYENEDKIRNFPTKKTMYTSKNPLF